MDKLLAGDKVLSKTLSGVYYVVVLNYDGSCVVVDMDGKHTYTVHITDVIKVS